ncbi:MAG: hypothetical protein ACXWDO_08585 [Bacteroidia bacterium]
MKIFIIAVCILFSTNLQAQTDSIVPLDIDAANSCYSYNLRHRTYLNYSYNPSTQTHNYSKNWDFDGDGDTDSLCFIGTGGAHLYFYLRIILTSDKKVRDYPFLELDFPCLGSINELKSANFFPPPYFPRFVVDYFDNGAIDYHPKDRIFLHLDRSDEVSEEWKKKGVTSRYLLLEYENGDMMIKNFMEYMDE